MNSKAYCRYRSYFWERKNLYNDLVGIDFFEQIEKAVEAMLNSFKSGGKILIFGNGGSAAEAQHFAAELVCKFEKQRRALPAMALTTDTSILTAQSNDDDFDSVFVRQIEAFGKKEDVAVGLTTSDVSINRQTGNRHSINILRGFLMAKTRGMATVGLVSQKTQSLLRVIDYPIIVPHENTALVQEIHLSVIHLLCERIEDNL